MNQASVTCETINMRLDFEKAEGTEKIFWKNILKNSQIRQKLKPHRFKKLSEPQAEENPIEEHNNQIAENQ